MGIRGNARALPCSRMLIVLRLAPGGSVAASAGAAGAAEHGADRRGDETPGWMADTIHRAGRRSQFRLCKQIVEPVFGHIKQARGFRQFLLGNLEKR